MEERNETGRGLGALSVIWSGEHHAYWKPPRGNGYTGDAFAAGVWPHAEAERMIAHCGPEKKVRVVDASTALLEHLSDYAEGSLYRFYIDQVTTWPRMQAAAPALYEALSEIDALPVQTLSAGVDSAMRPVTYVAYSAYDVQRIVRAALLLANTGGTENG